MSIFEDFERFIFILTFPICRVSGELIKLNTVCVLYTDCHLIDLALYYTGSAVGKWKFLSL